MTPSSLSRTPACLLVIFGATGDLAQRMLFPSLYGLCRDGLLPPALRILGTARSGLEVAAFRAFVDQAVRRFVPADDIDPLFFERSYFLAPAGDTTKAYRLLAETMEKAGRAGIATFVMRGKEYLVAIVAEDGLLRADTLRFADELRTPKAVGLPAVPKVKPADITRMRKLIKSNSSAKLAESELEDGYSERIRKLAAKKERRHEDVYELPEEVAEEEAGDAQVIDLVEVLKRSLKSGEGTGRKTARKTTRKAARRRKAS